MDASHLRNRIVGHRPVTAAALRPHPLNWRTHPAGQRAALEAVLDEVGIARSVLAYVADADKAAHPDPMHPAAPLTLIDGHGRRDVGPGVEWNVEVLDVTDEEARKLLLTMDSLAALAETDDAALAELRSITDADSAALAALWQGIGAEADPPPDDGAADEPPAVEQYLILVTCKNERDQARLLEKFAGMKLHCKPLTS